MRKQVVDVLRKQEQAEKQFARHGTQLARQQLQLEQRQQTPPPQLQLQQARTVASTSEVDGAGSPAAAERLRQLEVALRQQQLEQLRTLEQQRLLERHLAQLQSAGNETKDELRRCAG